MKKTLFLFVVTVFLTIAKSEMPSVQAVFLNQTQAAEALSSNDVYLQGLSQFDWNAKFKADKKLTIDELLAVYNRVALDWSDADKAKIQTAVDLLNDKINGLNFRYPKALKFILTNGEIEAGAAYTRKDYIVFPKAFMKMNQPMLNRIVAHEFFHVYSRHNKAHRADLYSVINYQPSKPIDLPTKQANLLISNPDAPEINYYIRLKHHGKHYNFMPLIIANRAYDKQSHLPFFAYMENVLIAVEQVDATPKPLMINQQPLITTEDKTNFSEVVMSNSDYLQHPEEISAENFSLWVVDAKVKYEKPIKELIKVMQSIQ